MLDKRGLEMICIIMREEISAPEERTDARFTEQEGHMDACFAKQKKQLSNRIEELSLDWDVRLDLCFVVSENPILGELDRVHMSPQSQLDDMRSKLDELTEYYRIKKLDDINQTPLPQMIQEVERRMKVLEEKGA